MTTGHASKIWGFCGGPLASLNGAQPAHRICRLAPLVHDVMYSTACRHYVVGAWPIASDAFGVAYPAGLLMVVSDAGLYGTGAIDLRCEQYWQNEVTGGGAANVFAVPQVLPGGYARTGQANFFGFYGAIYPGPPWVRMTASGVAVATGWTPRIATNGDTFTTGLGSSSVTYNTNGTFRTNGGTPITADVGYRSCQLQFSAAFTTNLNGGSLSYTISHNADGSSGSSTGDLDTIDYSGTVGYADINANTWLTIGGFNAPLGKPCRFAIRVTSNTVTYLSGGATLPLPDTYWNASARASLRCDIPFQNDIVGAGDLIAPGGYVP